MRTTLKTALRLTICLCLVVPAVAIFAQPPRDAGSDRPTTDEPRPGPPQDGRERRRGFGGRPGFGPGGPRKKRELVKQFDEDENGWLNQSERKAARAAAKSESGGGRRFGPPGGRGRGNREPAKPGPRVSPNEADNHSEASLYDPNVLRTLFLEFENDDWELELQDFHGTDVDVPATLTVDGKKYPNVGVRFRGMSSYGMVPTGYKRSFNVSLDLADEKQRLYGYKTLNLLNSAGDPSFMSTVLYSHIAGAYIPVPKANHVRVVVNGESWGVYVNVQQFDKVFLGENYPSSKGTRWKVSGSPGGDGGLRFLGDDIEEYKQRFDMKSNDGKKAWRRLIELCRVLNETPLDELETALEPLLDIDGTLKFLALDVALVNSDGYWTRASDYSLFLDKDKRFHVIPHDMNEAFHSGGRPGGPPRRSGGFGRPDDARGDRRPPQEGRRPPADDEGARRPRPEQDPRDQREPRRDERRPDGFGPPNGFGPPGGRPRGFGPGGPRRGPGGPGHGGVDLDPLVSIDNPRMPLRSRLLSVPKLKAKYLEYVRQIAEKSLAWDHVQPVIARHRRLIESEVAVDTKKLYSQEQFEHSTSLQAAKEKVDQALRTFFSKRRDFLLKYRPSQAKPGGEE